MGFMIDNVTSKEGFLDIDLEMGGTFKNNTSTTTQFNPTGAGSESFNNNNNNNSSNNNINNNNNNSNNNLDLSGGEGLENVKLVVEERKVVEGEGEEEKVVVKERPKTMSAKKPPKPPRPPRGLSLDSADQKLIRELHELAKLKRARKIERMKAVKKAREAKITSSKNQLFATLLTVLFCLVVLFQGISSRTSTAANFDGSPISSGVTQNSIISIQHNPISSASYVNGPGSESPSLAEKSSEVDVGEQANSAVG